MRHFRLFGPLFALLALMACQPQPTWYQDVKPIVDSRCLNCHKEGGIAPFSMESYDTAKPMAQAMAADVISKKMPPWHAGPSDVQYLEDPSLSQEQIDTISNWAKLGAQEGDAKKPGADLPKVTTGLDRVDLSLSMKEPYGPQISPDDYRCFPIDWPYSDVRYVTGFNAIPGNTKIVHHIGVFVVPPDAATKPDQWDADEPGPGYTCFGGPDGNRDQTVPIVLLSAWVPGSEGVTFPDGLGIAVQPGSKIVLQVHYNSGVGQQDKTQLDFKVDTQVQKKAVYVPWIRLDWVLGQMKIPAGANPVTHAAVDDPRSFWNSNFAPDTDFSRGFDVHSALFHMHQLGSQGVGAIYHADQTRTTFLQIPKWDFHWQREYRLKEPVSFSPGDKIELKCTFNNSPENQPYVNGVQQPPHDVNWGENTSDEMCVLDMLVTPR